MSSISIPDDLQSVTRSASLFQLTQDSIKQHILVNRLRPGDPLPSEVELTRRLGVSRSSVREAVKSLASLGILEIHQGKGVFVSDFSFGPLLDNLPYALLTDWQELADLLKVRRALEIGMIEDVIQQISQAQLVHLRQLAERMCSRAERSTFFPEEVSDFHHALFDHLNNKVLLKVLDVLSQAFHQATEHVGCRLLDPVRTYHDHYAIFEAVQMGDVEQARNALNQYYADLEDCLEIIPQA